MSRPLAIPATAPAAPPGEGEPLLLPDTNPRLEPGSIVADTSPGASETLVMFLEGTSAGTRWLLLRQGEVIGRGEDPATRPDSAPRVVAAVPGDAVTVHWIALPPGLSTAQAAAAARLAAGDLSAQPVEDLHIAVGAAEEGSETRAVALVGALAMIGWLSQLNAFGLDADVIIPEPLLLAPPPEGVVRLDQNGQTLVRGSADAFTVETALADFILEEADTLRVSAEDAEGALAAGLAEPIVNLRQGPFAKARRWRVSWPLVRRLARLGVALLLVTLMVQLASLLRYTAAIDRMDAETQALMASLTPGGAGGTGRSPFAAPAAALFAAIQDTPNVELAGLRFEGGRLQANVRADGPATLDMLQQKLAAGGYAAVAPGAAASAPWQPVALTVQAR